MAKHQLCWFEWNVTDLEKAKKFYSTLFEDWEWEAWGDIMYMFQPPGGGIGGGLSKADSVETGRSPAVYIQVDDVTPYLDKAKSAGGSVLNDKVEIPNMGWWAMIGDPDGNRIGLYQSLQQD